MTHISRWMGIEGSGSDREEGQTGLAPGRRLGEEEPSSASSSSSAFPWQPSTDADLMAPGSPTLPNPGSSPRRDGTSINKEGACIRQEEFYACEEEARRQFAQLLSRPEDLARIAELREAVAEKLHRADLEVSSGLEAATFGVQTGLEALHAARKSVVDTRDNFAKIDALCEEEGAGLADHHVLIRDLAVMRVNLARTIADAEAILSLPEQAAAATDMLSDERNLFACWEKLTELEQRAAPARAALEAARRHSGPHGGVSRAGSRPAATHFAAIDQAVERFESHLWRSVRSSLFAGRGGCRALVRALRVVEEQETLDALLAAKARKDVARRSVASGNMNDNLEHSVLQKSFKSRVLREVREAVEERYTMTVDSLIFGDDDDVGGRESRAAAQRPAPNIPVVLENLNVLMQQLTEAYDYAVPAFPPKYRIFESVMAPSWHRHVTEFLSKLVSVAKELSNADIIAVLNWYQLYAEQMAALGVDVETAPSGSSEGLMTPPPLVPETPQVGKQPYAPNQDERTEGNKVTSSGDSSEAKADGPSVLSLESFLATGCKKKEREVNERSRAETEDGGAEDSSTATPRLGCAVKEEGEEVMVYPNGLIKLVDTYTSRMSQTVHTWAANLHRMTASHPLKPADDGTLWTASDVEFFRLLNEQLEVAKGGGKQLLSAAAVVLASILSEFANQQYKRLGGDAAAASSSTAPTITNSLSVLSSPGHFRRPSSVSAAAAAVMEKTAQDRGANAAARVVEYNVLLAGVNDAHRCHRLALEIESSLKDELGSFVTMENLGKKVKGNDTVKGFKSIMQPALETFVTNAEHCARAAAAAVVIDPSVISLFGQLFIVEKGIGGGPWLEGETTDTLVATVEDYLGDVEQYVTPDLAPMVCEAVLTRVIKLTIEACMRQLHTIRPGTVDRMAADEEAIRECFAEHLPHKRLDPWIQRLADVRDVAAADDAESFVLAYGILVQSMPELGLEPAERLLAAREDIPRATQREVLEECKVLLESQLATQAASTIKSNWKASASKAIRFA